MEWGITSLYVVVMYRLLYLNLKLSSGKLSHFATSGGLVSP
jgi:hypothetical protein